MTSITQLVRFAIVGLLVALIYFGLFVLLEPAVNPLLANSIAYVVAITFQYFAQSIWTFGKNARDGVQAFRFGMTMIFAYLIATLITTLVAPSLAWPSYVAAGVVVVVLPITNFIVFKLWVFRSR